ncbi:hypothetical protein [Solidesulfovibrio carbinolicus]|uniref:Uncharacterized protein n=1 Tax=Solidesulfovibrio carbinolicus TaxID=296842 RepID=A0A4P6HQL9_9BACT|nr:hypothetical protein [Solidesulfovibrio carbinolicus]QAZ69086.1 hypothetical protein C3Y92_18320 [Solidesulfovibrio carbinolicus]
MKQQQFSVPPLVVAEQAGPSGALMTAAAGPSADPAGLSGRGVPAAFAGLRWRLLPDQSPARGHDGQP